ncbi:hypothetical protein EI94DRAFT_1811118 [Lactarius quietus]|nr:hypothetical protein EI94DRAFT_1811118 [Lactarius quietus]
MAHKLATCQANLAQLQYYTANNSFLHAVTQCYSHTGHILVEKATKNNALVNMVGTVVEQCLDCGPTGNFITGEFGSLQKVKYQLQLTKPFGTPFMKDYDTALNALKILQNQAHQTGETLS